jgi:hypothetical protein
VASAGDLRSDIDFSGMASVDDCAYYLIRNHQPSIQRAALMMFTAQN